MSNAYKVVDGVFYFQKILNGGGGEGMWDKLPINPLDADFDSAIMVSKCCVLMCRERGLNDAVWIKWDKVEGKFMVSRDTQMEDKVVVVDSWPSKMEDFMYVVDSVDF